MTTTADTAREAAATLRRVLAAFERGELTASSAHARALVRRLEGAAVALETMAGGTPKQQPDRGDG